jgi:hypothetical protein
MCSQTSDALEDDYVKQLVVDNEMCFVEVIYHPLGQLRASFSVTLS